MRRIETIARMAAGLTFSLTLGVAPVVAQMDLIVDQSRLASSWQVVDRTFTTSSCALVEQCIGGSGIRRLLRFDVMVANISQQAFVLGDPTSQPGFEFSPCHGHYHFQGFSEYQLLDAQGQQIVAGHKQAFCVLDTLRYLTAPWVPASSFYDCGFQGLQPGWADIYDRTLDCQWIDVTNVPAGNYVLRVVVNPQGILAEADYTNNSASVSVTLPAPAGLSHRPDGNRIPGAPLMVSKEGGSLRLQYDTTSCPAPDYNVFYGVRNGPWSYTYSGQVCGIGTSGSALVNLPDPAPGEALWFHIVGVDPAANPDREGGHGFDSAGNERPLRGTGRCSVGTTQPSVCN